MHLHHQQTDMFPVVIGLVAVALWLFYRYYVSIYKQWESRGFVSEPGRFPYGTDINFATLKNYQSPIIYEMYKKYAAHQYFGIYIMRTPYLVIKDPEIIRLVLSKEFSHFHDRFASQTSKHDLLGQHLFNLDGERWRALRVKLTPTFTSGKLKAMFPLFVSCSENLSNILVSQIGVTIDVKEITARYTTDTICSCAFGLETNSVAEPENVMRKLGSMFMKRSLKGIFLLNLRRAFPDINKYINIRITPQKLENGLMKVISDSVEYREKNGVSRNDFLDLLIQLKNKGSLVDDSKRDEGENKIQPFDMNLGMMTAQCFVFFVAGFETSSSVQSYCLYELALNPDIQKKLTEEIDKTIEKYGGVTYQAVQEMEYLDMIISETMRMYPTVPSLDRCCTKSFTLPAGHKLMKGDRIVIPLWSLHHDPQYFPDPEKFDPMRFSKKEKESIKPYTYMPFGEGPRVCIGLRFGLLQTKMGLITILRKFHVQRTEETQVPIEFKGSTVIARTRGPIQLKFVPRTQGCSMITNLLAI